MPAPKETIAKPEREIAGHLDTINSLLKQYGLLLESDKQLPSAVGTIIGEPVRGSWWGHSKGMLAYNTLKRFSLQPDVLTTKLLSAKTTFVHRPLWPSFLTIATSKEPWQTEGLSPGGKRLLKAISVKRELRTDEYAKSSRASIGELGEAARELEKKLLVYGEGFHSDMGSHAKRLETWEKWAEDHKYTWKEVDLNVAKQSFEKIAGEFKARFGVSPQLPWKPTGMQRNDRKD